MHKRGRKPRRLHHPQQDSTVAAAAEEKEEKLPHSQSPNNMEEVEEDHPQSQSPSRSQSPDRQPQQQLEAKEESQDQLLLPEQQPQEVEEQDPQYMAVSPPRAPAAHGARAPPPTTRKPAGKKGKPLTMKQRVAVQEKLDLLKQNLQPLPFVPEKALDFTRHERLFKALGLWDFAHLELDRTIRSDLLTHLIANYDPAKRCSSVNNVRIVVSRADLARALGLPVKKEKTNLLENKDADYELFAEEESVAVIMDFMSNWVMFQFHGDDACILPGEVMAATQMVREGQPQKVDWAGLIWTMVEKELLEVPSSGVCYYASHLQCLMRHQKPGIFEEVEEEHLMELPLAEEEEHAVAAVEGVTSRGNVEAFMDPAEKQDAGLSLGLGGYEDVLKDEIGELKENEQEQWFPGVKNVDGENCLRRCNLNGVPSMECEDVTRGEVGMGEEERYIDDISTKFQSLERLASTDLLQAMNTVNVSYCPPLQPLDPSSGDFLASRADALKSMELDPCTGGSSLFGNSGKRQIDESDDDNDIDAIRRFPHGDHHKRMRTDGPWDNTPLAFDTCMGQVQDWMGKAKILFAQKEQESMTAQMELQYLNNMLQEKDHLIQSLEKRRLEEQHKRQLEICRFEHELDVMARIVIGYKKALRETRHTFAEYRKQFPQGEKPLYQDDDDEGGGAVLTTRELERKRLEKEQEKCRMLQMVDNFEREWVVKFNGYADQVNELDKRLVKLLGENSLLKERFAKRKASDDIVE